MTHAKSKFVWDAEKMRLVSGRLPTKKGQIVKGEDLRGRKMVLVGCYNIVDGFDVVCHWGWS